MVLRCHRGYIVNMKKIESVSFAENNIVLSDSSNVPLSRTYRDAARVALSEMNSEKQQVTSNK